MITLIFILYVISIAIELRHAFRVHKVGCDLIKVQATIDHFDMPTGPSIYDNVTHLTFVSSNARKIKEVKLILGSNFPWKIRTHSVDLEEPQATPIEVSRSKCRQAIELCDGPVIVEDTSLCFNALNGMPGPYIKWFYEAIGNEGLVKLLDAFDDKSGQLIFFFFLIFKSVILYISSSLCTMCTIVLSGQRSRNQNLRRIHRRNHCSSRWTPGIWVGSYFSTGWIDSDLCGDVIGGEE